LSWLTGWQYRKSHNIRGSQTGAVTDYQIRITVHYGSGTDSGEHVYLNGKCRTDFGDIRFTSDDGVTELSYWMEYKVNGNYAIFWVKVPSIPISPNSVTIYIYYGNPSATTTSNIKNTSLWNHGDDFNDNSRDTEIWDTVNYGTGSPNEVNQRLEIYVPAHADWAGYVSKNYHEGYNFEVQILAHNTVIDSIELFIHTTKVTAGNPYDYDDWYRVMLYHHEGRNRFYAQKRVAGTATTLYYGAWLSSEEKIKIRVKNNTVELYEQDILRASDTYALGSRNIYIIVGGRGYEISVGTDWLDNVWIRKYVDPEPTHDVWGSEETSVPTETPISAKALYNAIAILETPISGKALYNAITVVETPISAKALYNVLIPNIRVIVTNESVTPNSGFAGDIVTYNAIVKDEYGNPLPEEFIADLLMNSTVVVDNQQFVAGVYDSSTGELTLVFTVPSLPSGIKTVKLKWEEQTI